MARLLVKTEGVKSQTLELRLGVNHIGRSPEADFSINHPTVSVNHCQIILSNDGVLIRDCGSTNGTFVNGDQVREAWLLPGQTVNLGDVELFVESTEINVEIPQYERDRPRPPVVLPDGMILCSKHPRTQATYRCTHCNETMCSDCVHVLRLKGGGEPLYLCPLCSHKCAPIPTVLVKKKKTLLSILQDTVKLTFGRSSGRSRTKKQG
jgi:pSer/pThr/pTyr-binding forkhead associated (FHA) protein